MKLFFVILLAFILGCGVTVKSNKKYKISSEAEPKILLEKNYIYWKELSEYQQMQLIFQMISLSDGILKFKIVHLDEAYVEMAESLEKIKVCVDNDGWNFYVSYENDLQIGTVLLQCMIQENMMDN